MNEHSVENFMKLATNGKKESRKDIYYRGVYENIASGKKVNWNFAAMFIPAHWFLYRKMYLEGFLVIVFMVPVLALLVVFQLLFIKQNAISVIMIGASSWVLCSALFGMFGNLLYVRKIHKKIDKNYHLHQVKNTDLASPISLFIFPIATPFIALYKFLSDRSKAKRDL